ncbi:DUF1684 domain-containing protein [Leifsonia poae]|uniref:DUF1684 domain-containing protein n=1 Tax=Leifsonia poae TaxID=110933 RepID=A0A9W6HCS7_9MICO|nr:DUF1684 domain-containing protein [Leifsonia poae]GLJ77695.1 hypothetical protein GCM10017584_32690 [Leifsonia poae]
MTIATEQAQQETFEADWVAWHDRHETARAAEHGFLAVTGLHWLTEEPTRFDDAPGAWSTGSDGPVVELDDGESLLVDGVTVTGRHAFGPIAERGGIVAAFGDAVVEVAKRGGSDIIRPRHPDNPLRTHYRGTPAYAPDARWAVPARFVPFDRPREVTVDAAVEGLQHVYEAPGVVEFELDGVPQRLTVFNGSAPGSLFALFTDATSGVTTYAANRSLEIAAPGADGSVLLDFTRAVNLPCAYTEFAICPLPPSENRLAVAIEAGERIPAERSAR